MAAAQMKFTSEARPSQYIVPLGNTEPTCMPLSGHFLDIEGRDTNSVYRILPHGDKERFLVLIFTTPLPSTKTDLRHLHIFCRLLMLISRSYFDCKVNINTRHFNSPQKE